MTRDEIRPKSESGGLWIFPESSFSGYGGYLEITDTEWSEIESAYGNRLCSDMRDEIDDLLCEGAETQEYARRSFRLADVQKRVAAIQRAIAGLLEALDLQAETGDASGMQLLMRPPQPHTLAIAKTPGADAWQRLSAAVLTGDIKTLDAVQSVERLESAVDVMWAFGHAAWQVQQHWARDLGGGKTSLDQEIIKDLRLCLVQLGYSDSFTFDSVKEEMSGPFWQLIHALWKLRPDSFAATEISTVMSKVKSSGKGLRRRTAPRR